MTAKHPPEECVETAAVFSGLEETRRYRRMCIKRGMEMEHLYGMRITAKAPSCFTLAKQEYGLRGTRLKVYTEFCARSGLEPNPKMKEDAS